MKPSNIKSSHQNADRSWSITIQMNNNDDNNNVIPKSPNNDYKIDQVLNNADSSSISSSKYSSEDFFATNSNLKLNEKNKNDNVNGYSWWLSFEKRKSIYLNCKNLLWLPSFIIGLIFIPFTIICYFVSYYHNAFYPIFPFVSDTGTKPPIASFFSQFIDTVVVTICVTFWARYKQVKYYLIHEVPKSSNKLVNNEKMIKRLLNCNLWTLINALVLASGCCLIGNFRSHENLTGHLIGVIAGFFSAIYLLFGTCYICQKLYDSDQIESRPISLFIFSAVFVSAFFFVFIFSLTASLQHGDFFKFWDGDFRLWWTPDLEGHLFHCLASLVEWISLWCFPMIFLCISRRLRLFKKWHLVSF